MIEEPFKKPPPSGDFQPPPKPKRYWWRFTLAAVVIVVASAAATATSALLYVESIAHALSHNHVLESKVQKYLSQTNGGDPQNILIIGSDKRASEPEDPGRSDTTILLRLDPDQNTISLMSIPRDLKVEIPGVGTDKFNAAFAYGGPKLTLQVVKEMTGLPINHVVNVDYLGFVRAVDAIECVYVDVDRRYYHSNVGVSASEEYAEINIQPGYQLLCGKKALQYVRYRHTDTDLVRAARQQDFLSDARERVPIADLVLDKHRTDRHLHRIHDLRHQRRRDDAAGPETVRRLAQRDDQRGQLPGRTRAELRLLLTGNDRRGGRKVPRQRSERRPPRLARQAGWQRRQGKQVRRLQEEGQEEEEQAEAGGQAARRGRAGPRQGIRRSRGEGRRPARSAAASPSSFRRGCRRAPPTRKAIPTSTSRTPACTTSRTPTAIATAPTGW